MIGLVALLLVASLLEFLRYIKPVTIRAGPHAVHIRKLPDSTVAVLDSNSRIALGREWKTGAPREVWLYGGALFTTVDAQDTTGLTIHLTGFDVVAYNHASLYCLNRKNGVYAWLKWGRATIVTHGAKPKKLDFLPGNVIEYTHLRFLTKKPGQPTSSLAD